MSGNLTRGIHVALRQRVIPADAAPHGSVLGSEQFRDERLNLRCARANAQAFCELMVDPGCGSFPGGNVRLLLDAGTRRVNVWRGVSGLRRTPKRSTPPGSLADSIGKQAEICLTSDNASERTLFDERRIEWAQAPVPVLRAKSWSLGIRS